LLVVGGGCGVWGWLGGLGGLLVVVGVWFFWVGGGGVAPPNVTPHPHPPPTGFGLIFFIRAPFLPNTTSTKFPPPCYLPSSLESMHVSLFLRCLIPDMVYHLVLSKALDRTSLHKKKVPFHPTTTSP